MSVCDNPAQLFAKWADVCRVFGRKGVTGFPKFILEEETKQKVKADFEILLPELSKLAGKRDGTIEQP